MCERVRSRAFFLSFGEASHVDARMIRSWVERNGSDWALINPTEMYVRFSRRYRDSVLRKLGPVVVTPTTVSFRQVCDQYKGSGTLLSNMKSAKVKAEDNDTKWTTWQFNVLDIIKSRSSRYGVVYWINQTIIKDDYIDLLRHLTAQVEVIVCQGDCVEMRETLKGELVVKQRKCSGVVLIAHEVGPKHYDLISQLHSGCLGGSVIDPVNIIVFSFDYVDPVYKQRLDIKTLML